MEYSSDPKLGDFQKYTKIVIWRLLKEWWMMNKYIIGFRKILIFSLPRWGMDFYHEKVNCRLIVDLTNGS